MGTSISQIIVVTTPPAGIAPGPATSLTISNISTVSLTLSWTPPASGSVPFAYQPQQQISGRGSQPWVPIGSQILATTVSVTGLSPATSYLFEVVTSNSTSSTTSATVGATTLSVAPSAPTGMAVVGTPTTDTIVLQWNAPITGTPPLSYQLFMRTPTGSGAFASVAASTTNLTQTVSGLTASSSYDFEVVATNQAGAGPASSILSNILTAVPSNVLPSAPTNVATSNITQSSATITWTAPATGTLPMQYVVQYQIQV